MKNLFPTLLLGAALLPVSAWAAEPLPYFNPGEDISTVDKVNERASGSNYLWHTYSDSGNQVFRVKPNSTGASYVGIGAVFTPELALEAGKVYEFSADISTWTARTQSKAIMMLTDKVQTDPSDKVVLKTIAPLPGHTVDRTFTAYCEATATTPKRFAIRNAGGGNTTWFLVDNISVREIDPMLPKAPEAAATAVDKNVTVSITLPTQSVVGRTLTSIDAVTVKCGDRVVKTWTNQTLGAKLEVSESAAVIGDRIYTVYCTVNDSDGEKATATVSVGNVSDIDPTLNTDYQFRCERDENNAIVKDEDGFEVRFGRNYLCRTIFTADKGITLEWEPYFEWKPRDKPAEDTAITYKVVRTNDGKVIADNLTETTVTDAEAMTVDATRIWSYKVYAKYADTEKMVYVSQNTSLHNPVPFNFLPTKPCLMEMAVLDGNHDMSAWGFGTGGSNMKYYGVNDLVSVRIGKESIILPGVDLKAGKTYRLDIGALAANIVEKTVGFSVTVGTSNTKAAQTTELLAPTVLNHMKPRDYSVYYTPEADGQYFFSVMALNPTDRAQYDNFGISHLDIYEVSTNTPEAVQEIAVKFAETPGTAVLTFNAPSKNVAGAALTAVSKIEVSKDGVLFKTIDNPAPGSEVSVEVPVELGVKTTYTAVACTDDGKSVGKSVDIMIVQPPYENHFDSANDLTGFTTAFPGSSAKGWTFQAEAVRSYPDKSVDQDAYLFSPPMHLEGGWFYKLQFLTWTAAQGTENNFIEVLIGDKPEIESMKKVVIPKYEVMGGFNSKILMQEWFSMPETGEYYLAWHSSAVKDVAAELYMDEVTVSDKIDPKAPNGVTDLKILPDSEGEMKGTVSFKLPTVDLAGNPITGKIYRYEIYRDGSSIKSEFNKEAGTEITFEDGTSYNKITEGVHLYSVICSLDSKTKGREISDIAKFGIEYPGVCENFSATEDADVYGKVVFDWDAPTQDYEGFPINTSKMTYTVGNLEYNMKTGEVTENILADGLEDTNATLVVKKPTDKQDFCKFFVRATSAKGKSPRTLVLPFQAIGEPYKLPLEESFSNYMPKIAVMTQSTGGPAQWGFNSENPVTGVQCVDGDRGLALMEVMFVGGASRMFTARINLDVPNPVLTFWLYNQTNDRITDLNQLAIDVREGAGSFEEVVRKTIDDWTDHQRGWHKVSVDLSKYAGRTVYIGFNGLAETHTFIHMDALRLANEPAVDLGVVSLNHPKPYVGVEHNVTAQVTNKGRNAISNATAVLKLDGKDVARKTIDGLAADETVEVSFARTLSRDMLGKHAYSIEVAFPGDGDLLDNTRTAQTFELKDNDFPTVENLQGNVDNDKVVLTWDEPALPATATEITDDLEGYDAWSTIDSGIGDYLLYDLDKGNVGGFKDVEMPNVPMYSNQSWFIFDASTDPFPTDAQNRYRSHSGNNMLASMFVVAPEYTYVNDVLVSPKLSGEAQTIKFWARGLSDTDTEAFSVLYSTEGTEMRDFQKNPAWEEREVGGEWKEFSYELPEGTRYFAIQHYAPGSTRYFLFVDDLTYTPEGDETLQVQGYNVYQNGRKLNNTILAEKTWTDLKASKEKDEYDVTAVYDRGESPASTVKVAWSGIDSVNGANVTIASAKGEILVSGAAGLNIQVVNAAGLVVASLDNVDNQVRIPVASGVYMVTAGSVSAKVLVK